MVNTKGFNPTTGEWNATLTGDYLWSNVNFGEAVTEAMTPLAWSVLAFTLDDWIFVPGIPSVGNIGGRPYLNISAFATVFSALGRGPDDLLRATEATLYMRLPDEMAIPLMPLSLGARLATVVNGLRVRAKQMAGVRRVSAYLAANPDWFERTRAHVQGCDRAGLRTLWQREISPHVKQGVWSVLGIATHSADYTMGLRRELDNLVGPDDASILIANVGDGNGLASLGPLAGLAKVASGEMSPHIITGSPGSAGRAEGVVRRLTSPEEGQFFRLGEVLVAVQTDIAWTLIFPRGSGGDRRGRAPLACGHRRARAGHPGRGRLRGRDGPAAHRRSGARGWRRGDGDADT